MNHHINICTFNARSLRNKITEISHFVNSHKIHILAVCETWLSDLDTDQSVALPGFQAPFRNDRATKGGGVCIYISTKISCTLRHDLNNPKWGLFIKSSRAKRWGTPKSARNIECIGHAVK